MANQMIALQSRNPQLPDPARATAQYANMMNMASQQRASQLQAERTRQEMEYAKAAEGRAVAGENRAVAGENRAAQKFSVEQSKALVSALGTGIVKILRDPSDASISQVGQTFAAVGLEQSQFGPLLKQIQDIPDANSRKLLVMDLVTQSPEAAATLKAVMPEVKSEKVGDATVFYDANANSPNFGQEIFRFTAAPEPVKMTQNVVDGAVINTNPYTGVSAESLLGDPTQNLNPAIRAPVYSSTGVRSPYAVGAGTGQPSMAPPVAPTAPPAQAVGIPVGGPRGAPGRGNTADVVYGFGKYGSPDKPISTMPIGEVQRFQRQLIDKTRGKVGAGPDKGTGAVGTYQFTYGTLKDYAPKVLGPNWRNTPFTPDVQEQLAKALYEDVRGGDLKKTWAGLPSNRPGQYANVPWEQVRDKIIQVESAGGGNRRAATGAAATPPRTPTSGAGTPPAAGKPQTVSDFNQQKAFKKTLQMVDYDAKTGFEIVSDLIKSSTSGGAEKIGSDIVGFFGEATPGRVALGQLATLKDSMTFEKLRGKLGAQISDADVRLVANTMGDIANVDIPWNERLAKWQNIVLPILVRGAGMEPIKRATPTGGAKGKPALDSFRRK